MQLQYFLRHTGTLFLDSLKHETIQKSKSLKSKFFLYAGANEGIQALPSTLSEIESLLIKNKAIKTTLLINKEGMHQEKY